jgi:hypothetical protein
MNQLGLFGDVPSQRWDRVFYYGGIVQLRIDHRHLMYMIDIQAVGLSHKPRYEVQLRRWNNKKYTLRTSARGFKSWRRLFKTLPEADQLAARLEALLKSRRARRVAALRGERVGV